MLKRSLVQSLLCNVHVINFRIIIIFIIIIIINVCFQWLVLWEEQITELIYLLWATSFCNVFVCNLIDLHILPVLFHMYTYFSLFLFIMYHGNFPFLSPTATLLKKQWRDLVQYKDLDSNLLDRDQEWDSENTVLTLRVWDCLEPLADVVLAKRLAGKSVIDMTYCVSGETLNPNSIHTSRKTQNAWKRCKGQQQ